MNGKRFGWGGTWGVVLVLASFVPAFAVPIVTSTVTDLGGGLFTYRYEVTNPVESAEILYEFGLFFSGDPSNVASPAGWDSIFGLGFVDWFSTDMSADLVAGASLENFMFESRLGPGEIQFATVGYDAISGYDPDHLTTFGGTTVGPTVSSVPEPSTMLLIGVGFVVGTLLLRFTTWAPRPA